MTKVFNFEMKTIQNFYQSFWSGPQVDRPSGTGAIFMWMQNYMYM